MSQEQLGVILGLNKKGIEGIESGENPNICAEKIKQVCETFHEYPGFLLYGHGHGYWERMLNAKTGEAAISDGNTSANILSMIKKTVEEAMGPEGVALLIDIRQLNDLGQRRAKVLINDLLKIKEYRKLI